MTNPTTDEYLVSLQHQIDKLFVKNFINDTLITELLYTAMIEQKLSTEWVQNRVDESRKILDRIFSKDDNFSKIYSAEKSSDLLSSVETEVSDALEVLSEIRKD